MKLQPRHGVLALTTLGLLTFSYLRILETKTLELCRDTFEINQLTFAINEGTIQKLYQNQTHLLLLLAVDDPQEALKSVNRLYDPHDEYSVPIPKAEMPQGSSRKEALSVCQDNTSRQNLAIEEQKTIIDDTKAENTELKKYLEPESKSTPQPLPSG